MAIFISLLVSILELCHGQMGGVPIPGGSSIMTPTGPLIGGIRSYYPGSAGSSTMASSMPGMPSGSPPFMGMTGPSFGGFPMGPSYMTRGTSSSFGTGIMGSRAPTASRPFMGPSHMSSGSTSTFGTGFMDSGGPTFMGSRPSVSGGPFSYSGSSHSSGGSSHSSVGGFSGRGSVGEVSSGHRGSVVRSGSTHTSRGSGRGGQPREGYIGARGGERGFPVHGGYCAGEMCADGGAAAGMGSGYGMGAAMAMDERLRTGRNEDIRMYEMFSGGPSAAGGMSAGMMPTPMMPPMGGRTGGIMGGGGPFGRGGLRLF